MKIFPSCKKNISDILKNTALNPSNMTAKKQCLLLLLVCSGIYLNTLGNGFVWDDSGLIAENTAYLENFKNMQSAFLIPHFGKTAYYRPMLWSSFFLDFYLWGLNPFGFHLTNTVIHILNTLCVYFFFLLLGYESTLCFFSAVLFALHPVQSEAVAWVGGRNDSLMVLFLLFSFILILKGRKIQSFWKSAVLYGIAFINVACALLTKETAIVFLPLLILIDFFHNNCTGKPYLHKKTIGVYLSLGLVCAGYIMLRAWVFREIPVSFSFQHEYPLRAITTPLSIYFYYIKVLFFPVNLTVGPASFIKGDALCLRLFISATVLVCIFISVIFFRKTLRGWTFGLLWVFVYLLPVCGVISMAVPVLEHRLYGATIGFSLATASACLNFLPYTGNKSNALEKISGCCFIILLIVLYGLLTLNRNRIWKDEFSLWRDTVVKSPNSLHALNNFGVALNKHKQYDRAIEFFKRALQHSPDQSMLYNNLGVSLLQKGDYRQAEAALRKALELDPREANAYNNLGLVFKQKGDYTRALLLFEKAIQLNPASPKAFINKGILFFGAGKKTNAIAAFKKALSLSPHNSAAHNHLGLVFLEEGNYKKAAAHFQKAMANNPTYDEALNNLSIVYLKNGELSKALHLLQKAEKLNPESEKIHFNLGIVFFNMGKIHEAIKQYEKCLQLNPCFVDAHFNNATAWLLLPKGKKKALYHFCKVLALQPDYPKRQLIEKTIAELKGTGK